MHTNFKNDLVKSREAAKAFPVQTALEMLLPGVAKILDVSRKEDLAGADCKIPLEDGTIVNIDFKVRSVDPRTWGVDDLAIEIYSVCEKQIRGYQDKSTDYLLWLFTSTNRTVLVPFEPFLDIYEEKWKEWEFWLAEPKQRTRMGNTFFHSQFAKVPFDRFRHIAAETELN